MKKKTEERINKIIEAEMKIVDEIIQNEQWYEGERRKVAIAETDPIVEDRVVKIFDKNADMILNETRRMANEEK